MSKEHVDEFKPHVTLRTADEVDQDAQAPEDTWDVDDFVIGLPDELRAMAKEGLAYAMAAAPLVRAVDHGPEWSLSTAAITFGPYAATHTSQRLSVAHGRRR